MLRRTVNEYRCLLSLLSAAVLGAAIRTAFPLHFTSTLTFGWMGHTTVVAATILRRWNNDTPKNKRELIYTERSVQWLLSCSRSRRWPFRVTTTISTSSPRLISLSPPATNALLTNANASSSPTATTGRCRPARPPPPAPLAASAASRRSSTGCIRLSPPPAHATRTRSKEPTASYPYTAPMPDCPVG
ncbi:unnamed protein product [Ectocarpus fasciculatus]